jgi:hypothetical protein
LSELKELNVFTRVIGKGLQLDGERDGLFISVSLGINDCSKLSRDITLVHQNLIINCFKQFSHKLL